MAMNLQFPDFKLDLYNPSAYILWDKINDFYIDVSSGFMKKYVLNDVSYTLYTIDMAVGSWVQKLQSYEIFF